MSQTKQAAVKQELAHQDYVERAKKADSELRTIQDKYGVRLVPRSEFQYLPNGITVKSEVVWVNGDKKAKKIIKKGKK